MSENTEKIMQEKSKSISEETVEKKSKDVSEETVKKPSDTLVLKDTKPEEKTNSITEKAKEKTSDTMTLKDTIPKYIKHLEEEGKSKSTRYTVNLDLGYLMQELGEKKELKNILTVHIAKFFKSEIVNTSKNKPRSIHTINQIKRIVRQFLVWCKEQGYIDVLPLTKEESKFLVKNKKTKPEKNKNQSKNKTDNIVNEDITETIVFPCNGTGNGTENKKQAIIQVNNLSRNNNTNISKG